MAEDVMDAVNDLMNEHVDEFMMNAGNFVEELQDDDPTDTDDTSTGKSKKGTSEQAMPRKIKKKNDPALQSMCDLLERIHRDTNARLKDLASCFGFSSDMGKARKKVYSLITKVPDLNLSERFRVCDKLLGMPERLEFFMALPEIARHRSLVA